MVAKPGFGGIADSGVEIGLAFRQGLNTPASVYMPAPTDKVLMQY